jgi:hypothetical protein
MDLHARSLPYDPRLTSFLAAATGLNFQTQNSLVKRRPIAIVAGHELGESKRIGGWGWHWHG